MNEMKDINTNFKNEIGFLAKPISILTIIIFLFILLITFSLKQINAIRSKIASNTKIESQLRQKVQTLETVEDVLSEGSTFLDIVLPSKGSVLYGLSQIKAQSLIFGVSLSSLKTGTQIPVEGGVNKASISFEVEGDEQSIYAFLGSFSKLLPLTSVDKVSLSKSENSARANVTLNVYSSELPKKIPALTEPIKELSKEEITLLKELSTYAMPQFVEPNATQINSTKTDPFN